ncbi:DUF421 domain-containing protein [Paenibacillus sp. N1-5-1-14]|uniref:DUF421 domain-containing protein n=1 Tax=Paenibacillus radicibacter TaxID=2972488 RepID=UPI002159477F|nr:DUF421 domain-containing protein [Paenibacillus radicibacter]MCR8643197.1 DUF421 domain-containing protein [Paenibacillus radicibacter]
MNIYLEITLRALAAFTILMLTARVLGKQTLAQMTYFDFISSVTLVVITANIVFNTDYNVFHLIYALLLFATIILVVAQIALKNRKFRKLLAGDPTIVIQNGKILEHNMRKMRYTLDSLNQELRERNIFNMNEVLFAILEINGILTVLKKPQYRTVTRKDLWIATKTETRLPIELIMDGTVIEKNLSQNNLTIDWLHKQLTKNHLQVSDVTYAVLGVDKQLYIDTYDDHLQSPMDEE